MKPETPACLMRAMTAVVSRVIAGTVALVAVVFTVSMVHAEARTGLATGFESVNRATNTPGQDARSERLAFFAPAAKHHRPAPTPPRTKSLNVPVKFDVVSLEASGDGVAAGTAPPGWAVEIIAGDQVVGRSRVDADGQWLVLFDQTQADRRLAVRDQNLRIVARAPNSGAYRTSSQSVVIRFAKDEAGRLVADLPMVALVNNGQKPRVLQRPKTRRYARLARIPGDDQVAKHDGLASRLVEKLAAIFSGRSSSKPAAVAPADAKPATVVAAKQPAIVQTVSQADKPAAAVAAPRQSAAVKSAAVTKPKRDKRDSVAGTADHTVKLPVKKAEKRMAAATQSDAKADKADHVTASASSSHAQASRLAAASQQAVTQKTATGYQKVVVRPGDTLWKIAARHLGDGHLYRAIMKWNRKIKTPDMIYPNQVIRLKTARLTTEPRMTQRGHGQHHRLAGRFISGHKY